MKNTTDNNIEFLVEDYMMNYSAYTLLHRAIPDLRDGCKPSVKRIIYSMYANKMTTFTKSLDVVGTVSKIHPHGSAYPTIVGLCQGDKQTCTLLDYNGNMGQHTSKDLQPASDRYTDVKLSQFTLDVIGDGFTTNQVQWTQNYDGTIAVPEVLPVQFPLILSQSQSGIGVGFASNIASYNINDIADAVIKIIDNKKYDPLIPDFATGGLIINEPNVFDDIDKTGGGTIRLRGTATIDKNTISITEIPYTTTREAIIDKIVQLAKNELNSIVDVVDLTGNNKMEILVTARRNTDMKLLLEQIYLLTPLESTHSSNHMVIHDGLPKKMGTYNILKNWIEWRKDCVRIGLKHQITKLEDEKFAIVIYKNLLDTKLQNKIIKIIQTTPTKTKTLDKFNKECGFTYKESEFIYNMRLNKFNQTFLKKEIEKLDVINKKIEELESLYEHPEKQIKNDMNNFKKKYGAPRKTKVINNVDTKLQNRAINTFVDDGEYWITITDMGYIYKTTTKGKRIKTLPKDTVKQQWKLYNHTDEIIVFTHSRQGYKLQIESLEIDTPYYAPSELGVNNDDIISYGCVSKNYPIIVQLLEKGRIVKLHYTSFEAGVNVFANTHNDKFNLTHVLFLEKEQELTLTNKKKQQYTVHTEDIRYTKSRTGSGQYVNNNRRYDFVKVES